VAAEFRQVSVTMWGPPPIAVKNYLAKNMTLKLYLNVVAKSVLVTYTLIKMILQSINLPGFDQFFSGVHSICKSSKE